MAKKSGSGGIALVLVGGVVALVTAVPKEIWILLAVVGAIGLGAFLIAKVRRNSQSAAEQPADQRGVDGHVRRDTDARRTALAQEPVPVSPLTRADSGRRVPTAPPGYGAASWIRPGQPVTVAGVSIPGGMVYVGTTLKTPSGQADPSLIDPSKKVASRGDYTDRNSMGYWPSYSQVSPEARRAYLQWLAGGRRDPNADIGYVFLFFYGLERRIIIDGQNGSAAQQAVNADLPAITTEVQCLLDVYGSRSGSFKRYATQFLSMLQAAVDPTEKLYSKPVPLFPDSRELPLYVRLALGQCAMDAVPVPCDLALSWVRSDPNINLRTSATRCPAEFQQLFERKYAELFPDGLLLPKNKTKLKSVYRPASSGLLEYGEIKLDFNGNIPDVAVLTGPVSKLQRVVDAASAELDAYSRLIGRSPEAANSLSGLLLLSPTLWPNNARLKVEALVSRAGRGMVVLQLKELISSLGGADTFDRSLVTSLARTLEAVNIGMEPDVLSGAKTPKADDKVVLFALPPGEPVRRDSPSYQAACLTLQLATTVALADGDIGAEELRQLRRQIEGWNHLAPAHQQRLRAHLRYLLDTRPTLAALKKKLEPLPEAMQQGIARFMSVVAQADGQVSPAEIKMLEKVYKALGLDSQKVFSDVHAAAAETSGTAAASALPASKRTAPAFHLDAARIAALQHDTDKAAAVLASIFTEEPVEAAAVAPAPAEPDEPPEAPYGLVGLDFAHASFVNHLVARSEWTREELLDLASDLELMLDGALEKVNEASFDAHDAPLTEGDDPVTINRDILEKAPA